MKFLAISLTFILMLGCGVKGNPLPPLEEPLIGRGKPSFQKATLPLRQPKKASTDDEEWKEDSDFQEEPKR